MLVVGGEVVGGDGAQVGTTESSVFDTVITAGQVEEHGAGGV